jgi:phage tail-like protein
MAENRTKEQASRYLHYLPAIFHFRQDAAVESAFINDFLLAIERILHGPVDEEDAAAGAPPEGEEVAAGALPEDEEVASGTIPGIEATIDRIYTYLEPGPLYDPRDQPQHAPAEFLSWLASWVALSLRHDWPESTRRYLIGQVVPLYRGRGTRAGLARALEVYAVGLGRPYDPDRRRPPEPGSVVSASVRDFARPMGLGAIGTVGVDSWVGSAPPNYFIVQIDLKQAERDRYTTLCRAIRDVVDEYRPAHTYYDLFFSLPTVKLGDASRSTLGTNSFLSSSPIPLGD